MCALNGFFYVRHLKETKTPLCLSASRRLLSPFCALMRKIADSHLFLFLFLISLRFLLTLKIRILLFPFWNAHLSNLNKQQNSSYSKMLPFSALTEDYKEACAAPFWATEAEHSSNLWRLQKKRKGYGSYKTNQNTSPRPLCRKKRGSVEITPQKTGYSRHTAST